MAKLTREQFIKQFPVRCDVSNIKDLLRKDEAYAPPNEEPVPVFRCLNKLFVKVSGVFYSHS